MSLSKEMNLSMAGCGFLGIYHIGVASCINEYAPNLLVNKISGASAGSIAACSLLCGVSMGQTTSDILKVATIARKSTFGAFSPGFNITNIIRDRLNEALPQDAHKICSGRLHISVTRVSDGQNVILSEFNTREELIQAVLCSSFIPFFSGIVPEKFRGVRYIDGCYSNNLPILDENTITVSPFCGESDICPQDNSYNLFQVNFNNTSIELSPQNLMRLIHILFPPQVEVLSDMCKQGFDDALRFLQRNKLVSCVRCIAVNSELQLQDTMRQFESEESSDSEQEFPLDYEDEESCDDCSRRLVLASVDDFPEAVVTALEEAALSMNSGLINWVFQHKSMRFLSVLTLPYILPIDIARAVYEKFRDMVPKFSKDLTSLAKWLAGYLRSIIHKLNQERHLYGAKISCQLAITEYDFTAPERLPSRVRSRSVVNRNINRQSFTRRPLSGDFGLCPHKEKLNPSSSQSRRTSCVNFAFTMDLAGSIMQTSKPLTKALDANKIEEKVVDIANTALLSRETFNRSPLCAEAMDTYDQALQVTRDQDSIMAYYYLDDDNCMQVTQIFDATNSECGPILFPDECEVNRKLEWDETFTELGVKEDTQYCGYDDDDLHYDYQTDIPLQPGATSYLSFNSDEFSNDVSLTPTSVDFSSDSEVL